MLLSFSLYAGALALATSKALYQALTSMPGTIATCALAPGWDSIVLRSSRSHGILPCVVMMMRLSLRANATPRGVMIASRICAHRLSYLLRVPRAFAFTSLTTHLSLLFLLCAMPFAAARVSFLSFLVLSIGLVIFAAQSVWTGCRGGGPSAMATAQMHEEARRALSKQLREEDVMNVMDDVMDAGEKALKAGRMAVGAACRGALSAGKAAAASGRGAISAGMAVASSSTDAVRSLVD